MKKSVFNIPKMDCAAEEQLIRMKLEGTPAIERLNFDLAQRRLDVFHSGPVEPVAQTLDSLRLGSNLVNSAEVAESQNDELSELTQTGRSDRQLLIIVLIINAFFFLLELVTGFIARSMGLVADSLDMLADAIVYGLSLYALGRSATSRQRVARLSGYFQLALAVGGLFEVVRRFIGAEALPGFQTMIGISLLALVGNGTSLYLLQKSKSKEVNMQASQIFTSNDVIANIGVMVAGGLVYLTGSKLPDLIVGGLVFFLVAQGAFRILNLSRS
jgi:Co/Zn/Cd efflux system component